MAARVNRTPLVLMQHAYLVDFLVGSQRQTLRAVLPVAGQFNAREVGLDLFRREKTVRDESPDPLFLTKLPPAVSF